MPVGGPVDRLPPGMPNCGMQTSSTNLSSGGHEFNNLLWGRFPHCAPLRGTRTAALAFIRKAPGGIRNQLC